MKLNRTVAVLSTVTSTVVLTGVLATTTASAGPYCGITWGSLLKSTPAMTGAPVVGARVGKHECWDRLVIDIGGTPAPGYRVRYVDGLYNQDTGERVPMAGGAVLMVIARAQGYDEQGNSTVPWRFGTHIVTPQQFTAGKFSTFRDLVYGGSFEG